MLHIGTESISRQENVYFIEELRKLFENIVDTVKLTIPDIAVRDHGRHTRDAVTRVMKKGFKRNIILREINLINSILKKRFGANIRLDNIDKKEFNPAYLLIPPYNMLSINTAMDDITELFPVNRDNSVLGRVNISKPEDDVYTAYKELAEALRENAFEIDHKNAVIKGLRETVFEIKINFLLLTALGLTIDEMLGIFFHEIGHVFSYLEYMFISTNNSLILLDTFLNEKFNKQSTTEKSFKTAFKSVDVKLKDTDTVSVIQALDVFIAKTFKLENNRTTLALEHERLADAFTAKFDLAHHNASGLAKILIVKTTEDPADDKQSFWLTTLEYAFKTLGIVISIATLGLFVPFVMILTGVYLLTKAVVKLLISVLVNLLHYIIGADDSESVYDSFSDRVRRLRLEMISQLRVLAKDAADDTKERLINNIKDISSTLESVNKRLTLLAGVDDSTLNYNNYSIENYVNLVLQENVNNDIYVNAGKFSLLHKR